MQNSESNYPTNWDEIRKKVYKNANYTCQICGSSGGKQGDSELHAHHKIPISNGGSHQMSNLECLCSGCHSRVHGRPIGDVSTLDLANSTNKSKTDTSSTDEKHTYLDDLRNVSLEIASVSFEALYHLSQAVVNSENVSIEEEISQFIKYTEMGNLFLLKYTSTVENFESGGRVGGMDQILNHIHNRVERVSYGLVASTYIDLYETLNDAVSQLEETTDSEQLHKKATKLLNSIRYNQFIHIVSIQRADFAAKGITSEGKAKTVSEEWKYCPNCGFEYTMLDIGDNDDDVRRCFFCGSMWEISGLIWKKWKCTFCKFQGGTDITGERRKSEDWRERGKKANDSEFYRDLDELTTNEVAHHTIYTYKLYTDENKEVIPTDILHME